MSGGHIPAEFFETSEMQSMWYELNRHIVTMNDIVSLKKELVRHPFPFPILRPRLLTKSRISLCTP